MNAVLLCLHTTGFCFSQVKVEESSEQADDEVDDGTDLNMMCCSVTEVEPVSRECFSDLVTRTVSCCSTGSERSLHCCHLANNLEYIDHGQAGHAQLCPSKSARV